MNGSQNYNPDVLNCLANLSNDEVFTPPELANKMLDLLPQELFQSPNTTFLDPFTKSGVFLREIVSAPVLSVEKQDRRAGREDRQIAIRDQPFQKAFLFLRLFPR